MDRPGTIASSTEGVFIQPHVPIAESAASLEALFLDQLPVIDRIVVAVGRRHRLPEPELDDFQAWVRYRLVETDYAIFRKFGGRSSLATYLAVVVANLFRDYRNSRWGRWRPSATATRLGPLAVRYEALVYRDGHSAREAIELLKSTADGDEAVLRRIRDQVPARTPPREVSLETPGTESPTTDIPTDPAARAETDAAADRAESILQQVLASLPGEDRVIVQLRFWDDFAIADIARHLGLDQKRLYRRVEAIQRQLKAALEARGVDRRVVAELLGRGANA